MKERLLRLIAWVVVLVVGLLAMAILVLFFPLMLFGVPLVILVITFGSVIAWALETVFPGSKEEDV